MRVNLLFIGLLIADSLLLGTMIGQISISSQEAYGIFEQKGYVFSFARFFLQYFGQNDFALRLPFLCVHLCNICLIFSICKNYLTKPQDSLLCALIYSLLPGINITSILVSKSVFIVFFALLLCFFHLKKLHIPFFILCILGSLLDISFSIIFLALFFYALRFKQNKLLVFSLVGFSINMYCFSLPIGGLPRGHFLDTVGLLALLYSPLLLIFYIFTLYQGIVKKENSLMLYIATTSILFSLLLSLRQAIDFFSFLPLSTIGLPIMIKDFLHSIRLRLPQFRKAYLRRFYIILIPLVFESILLFGNKFLFLFEPKRHFLSNFYFAKELAQTLKSQNITSLKTFPSLQAQLKFYGISQSSRPILKSNNQGKIKIIYLGKNAKAYSLKE